MQTLQKRLTLTLAVVLAGLLVACSPWLARPRQDDHPLIHEAMARKASSPREAVALLEKALDANPRLARAHWELALLHLNSTSNYAASVYHFQKVLALRPDWPQANTATQLIARAKLELIKEGFDLPVLPSVQRQLDRYVAEIHRLNNSLSNLQTQVRSLTVLTQQLTVQNLQLRQQLLAMSAVPAPGPPPAGPALAQVGPSAAPAPAPPGKVDPRENSRRSLDKPRAASAASALSPTSTGARPSGSAAQASAGHAPTRQAAVTPAKPGGRTHTIRPGETAQSVAKQYHLTLRDLMRANPGVNLRQLRPGQNIQLP